MAPPDIALSYAAMAIKNNLNVVSIDFKVRTPGFFVSARYIGAFCITKFGLAKTELYGVHRYGFNKGRSEGFIKIRTKARIDVNQRFGRIGGRADDDNIEMKIRGIKTDDGSQVIRILSPNEELSLFQIENEIGELCETNGKIYEETFAGDIPLFGGLANGNYRMRAKFKKEVTLSDGMEITIDSKKVKLVPLEMRKKCFRCKGPDHMIARCPENNSAAGEKDIEPSRTIEETANYGETREVNEQSPLLSELELDSQSTTQEEKAKNSDPAKDDMTDQMENSSDDNHEYASAVKFGCGKRNHQSVSPTEKPGNGNSRREESPRTKTTQEDMSKFLSTFCEELIG